MKWIIGILIVLFAAYWTAAYFLFRYACARKKRPDEAHPAEAYPALKKYEEQVLSGIAWFKSKEPEVISLLSYDGLKLTACYVEHPEPKGTIILMHGYGSLYSLDFGCVYEYYYNLGYSLLAVNQRAHGDSEGRYIYFGTRERYDCQKWAQYIASRIPSEQPIFLDGLSMGTTTVLMASGLELPSNVKGIIADCGFTSPWEEFCEVLKRAKVPARPLLDSVNLWAKICIGFDFREYSTLEAMKINKLPILFVHGEADRFVPPRFTYENYKACRAEKYLVTVPEAYHGMSYLTDTAKCRKAIEEFLNKYSKSGVISAQDGMKN